MANACYNNPWSSLMTKDIKYRPDVRVFLDGSAPWATKLPTVIKVMSFQDI